MIETPKPPEEKKEKRIGNYKGKQPKYILTDEQKTQMLIEIAREYPVSQLMKKYHMGFDAYNKILITEKKCLDELKEKMLVERRNLLVPTLYKQLLDDLDHLKSTNKINKAKYGEIMRGIKDLHSIARLEDNKSTENTEINISSMSKEDLLRYINGSEQIDNIASK